MKLAIMQPYFLPYIGYFQLIAAVDRFVMYDNIKYTKKGWINRNRMLQNDKEAVFTLALKSDSDNLFVCERELSAEFSGARLLSQFSNAYRKAPYFDQTIGLLESIVLYPQTNLFHYIHHSVARICQHLEIGTEIIISSEIEIDHNLKNQYKVLALCKALGAKTYVNAIGGMELYTKQSFQEQHIELTFIRSRPLQYPQFGNEFIPWLSIVDVLMFNPRDQVCEIINNKFDLI